MENLDVKQDVPDAVVLDVQIGAHRIMRWIEVPFVNQHNPKAMAVSIFKVIKNDTVKVGALLCAEDRSILPEEIQTQSVFIDPCLYMQQDGGCSASPFWSAGWVVDSTGNIIEADVSSFWKCTLGVAAGGCAACLLECILSNVAYALCVLICCGGSVIGAFIACAIICL